MTIEGERKLSEIKVSRIRRGDLTVTIEPKKKHEPHEASDHAGDPRAAADSVRGAGFEVVGKPRRKPKHFEILGRKNEDLCELHVSLDGSIRQMKPVEPTMRNGKSRWPKRIGERQSVIMR